MMTASEICAVCGKGTLRTVRGTYETEFVDRRGDVMPLFVPDVSSVECENCERFSRRCCYSID